MATTTENLYVGDGTTVLYSFTFPYIKSTDVKLQINAVDTTEYSLANATTVELVTPPAVGAEIRIYRDTDVDSPEATFFPGSAIRAQDLNDNFTQTIYATQESQALIADSDAATVKDIADTALAQSTVALAAAQDAQSSADDADAKADNAVVIASTKVDLTSSTGSAVIPAGSTSERDGTPQEGYFRYNTVTDTFEGYTNVGWGAIAGGGGGDVEEAPEDGNQYARQDGDWSVVSGGDGGTTIITEYSGASAWGYIAVDGTLNDGLNATVTKIGTGQYVVTFLTPLPNANYSVNATTVYTAQATIGICYIVNKTATGFKIDTSTYTGSAADYDVSFSVFSQNALPPKSGTGTDAWASCAVNGVIEGSFNIASVTKVSTGIYDVLFSTPMPSANYAVTGAIGYSSKTGGGLAVQGDKTVNGFRAQLVTPAEEYFDYAFNFTVNATNASLPQTVTQEQIDSAINNPGASAWGTFDGTDGSLKGGLNVASVTRTNNGQYTVVFSTAMASANYSVVASSSGTTGNNVGNVDVVSQSANGFDLKVADQANSTNDAARVNFTVFATNALPLTGGTGTDAWGSVAADGTLKASFNISTVSKGSTGRFSVVFTTPMPSSNYSISGAISDSVSDYGSFNTFNKTSTGFDVLTIDLNGGLFDYQFDFQVNATNAVLPQSFTEAQIQSVLDFVTNGGLAPAAFLTDQKPSETMGGSAVVGWQTRTLNTEVDADSIVTLNNNEFTLAAGTYDIEWSAPSYKSGNNQTRLTNVTSGTTQALGSCEVSNLNENTTTSSSGSTRVNITSDTTYKVEHFCANAVASTGLGVRSGSGEPEVYTQVKITGTPS